MPRQFRVARPGNDVGGKLRAIRYRPKSYAAHIVPMTFPHPRSHARKPRRQLALLGATMLAYAPQGELGTAPFIG